MDRFGSEASRQKFKCGVQWAGSDVLTEQGQLGVFEVVSAGILNPGVKWPVSVMYDVEGTEGWHPGLGNVYQAPLVNADRQEAHMTSVTVFLHTWTQSVSLGRI